MKKTLREDCTVAVKKYAAKAARRRRRNARRVFLIIGGSCGLGEKTLRECFRRRYNQKYMHDGAAIGGTSVLQNQNRHGEIGHGR